MQTITFELSEDREQPGLYSAKINGVEVAQHISELTYTLRAGGPPTLSIKTVVEGIHLDTRALLEIPEPYGSFIERANKKHAPD